MALEQHDIQQQQSGREAFDSSLAGAQERPWLPRLRSDPSFYRPLPHNLLEFRQQEGPKERERHLRDLWRRLPKSVGPLLDHETLSGAEEDAFISGDGKDDKELTHKRAQKLKQEYESELMGRCHGAARGHIGWREFRAYADAKEVELWHIFHDELDLDGNGHLDSHELQMALEHAGIHLEPSTLTDFMSTLTTSPHSHAISFVEFRDFLLLLPRPASTKEIYRYYEVKKSLDPEYRSAGRLNMEGDVSLNAEDRPHPETYHEAGEVHSANVDFVSDDDDEDDFEHEDEHEHESTHHWLGGTTALKFLLAGGIAGAVSRTCTAPFDRLKIFLITRPPDLGGTSLAGLNPQASVNGVKAIGNAVRRIYAEGGVRGFWVGNGLSVTKIFPESAIKFLAYESSKRMFARYVDNVEDQRNISGSSRFMSGGIAGMTSQLAIYPIETLKTQMMSSTGESKCSLLQAAQKLYALGGVKAYYRGLGIGLVGVFPYAAIDMSTFEALKLAYLRSTGKDEPGVLALLAFGSVSGSVGATTVYPLNLVRTRLQASGSSGHPQKYTGIADVVVQTYQRDGWRGFYRGLFPTLAKVIPAVSISYVVYEQSKSNLGV